MKHSYIVGCEAKKNFEEGMKAIFNVPKDAVVRAERKKLGKKASSRGQSVRKPNRPDKD